MADPGGIGFILFKRVHLICIFMLHDHKKAMCENLPHMAFLESIIGNLIFQYEM